MKKITFILFLYSTSGLSAQSSRQEIDNQVWKPFIKTFSEFDTDGFLALHSRSAIRAPRDSKTILTWSEYFTQQKKGDDAGKARGSKRLIELRFSERINTPENAIDIGVYKTTSTNAKGEARSFFGRFLVVLHKEQGVWKIMVDTDSSEGGAVGEKDFAAAKPLE